MMIRFTEEDRELASVQRLLDARHHVEMLVTEATVEQRSRYQLLSVLDLIAKELEASGYKGRCLDVGAYAQALFEMEDDIPFSGCDTIFP